MKKIPTVFVRDDRDRSRVNRNVTSGCEWVLEGEGVCTRKFDGTCTMFDGERWWARREVKAGKNPPEGWVEADSDELTGKRVGWEPAEQSSFAKYLAEALERTVGVWQPWTYELIGPKINGNPERWEHHALIRHGMVHIGPPERTFDAMRDWLRAASTVEGFVFHHPDGRMAKIKLRDFGPLGEVKP